MPMVLPELHVFHLPYKAKANPNARESNPKHITKQDKVLALLQQYGHQQYKTYLQ